MKIKIEASFILIQLSEISGPGRISGWVDMFLPMSKFDLPLQQYQLICYLKKLIMLRRFQ